MQALVTQVAGLGEGDGEEEDYRNAVDFVSKNLEFAAKAGASQDMRAMDNLFNGCNFSSSSVPSNILICMYIYRHIQKARINSNDDLAEALQVSYRLIKGKFTRRDDLDSDHDIRVSSLSREICVILIVYFPRYHTSPTTSSSS